MSTVFRNFLWFLGVVAVLAIGYYFADILTYILLAWVLSMLGRPVMDFLQKRVRYRSFHLGPTGAAVLTIAGFYLALAGVLMLFVPSIVGQARNLAGVDYQALGEKLRVPFADLDESMHRIGLLKPDESLAVRTQEVLSSFFKPALVGDFVERFLAIAGGILVTLAAVTFMLFFFLKDNTLFIEMLHALVPNEMEDKTIRAVNESSKMLTRYFGGLVVQIASFITLLFLLLWILGVKNALLIGAFGGLFNVIPYIGPIIGMFFGGFITISSNLDLDFNLIWPMLLKVAAAFAATQFVDNNLLGPAIFSKSVKAHPLEIFIVTLVAAKLGGVLGMVLGIPVYTVLRVIARVFFSEFKVVQRLTDSMGQPS
jgi:predicted PurR-regulated permease PerM